MDAETIVLSSSGLLFAASAVAWTLAITRRMRGEILLPHEPAPLVPWRATEVLVGFVISFATQVATLMTFMALQGQWTSPELEKLSGRAFMQLMALSAAGTLVSAVAMGCWVRIVNRATSTDLGMRVGGGSGKTASPHTEQTPTFVRDLRLGLQAFLLIVPPVLLIQGALTRWFPSQHPIQTLMEKHCSPGVFLLAGLSAVIIAPLTEEFVYRVILQGWLERITVIGLRTDILSRRHSDPALENRVTVRSIFPIVASAAIFASLHLGHGPDPIPLFVLALALGYLYQRTHRLLPGLIVHLLLNAWSMAVLAAQQK